VPNFDSREIRFFGKIGFLYEHENSDFSKKGRISIFPLIYHRFHLWLFTFNPYRGWRVNRKTHRWNLQLFTFNPYRGWRVNRKTHRWNLQLFTFNPSRGWRVNRKTHRWNLQLFTFNPSRGWRVFRKTHRWNVAIHIQPLSGLTRIYTPLGYRSRENRNAPKKNRINRIFWQIID
jgi:hypothetical protein